LLAFFAVELPYFVRQAQPEMHCNLPGYSGLPVRSLRALLLNRVINQQAHPFFRKLFYPLRFLHRLIYSRAHLISLGNGYLRGRSINNVGKA
jgi:hypothetical protein